MSKFLSFIALWALVSMSVANRAWASEWPQSIYSYGSSFLSSDKMTQVNGVIGFKTDGYNNSSDQSLGTGLLLDGILKYRLTQEITTIVDAAVVADTGYSQVTYVDDYQPSNNVLINEISLGWSPIELLNLKIGALNQAVYDDPIFLSNIPFPEATQTLTLAQGNLNLEFSSGEAVPSSSTSSPVTTQTNGLPALFLERIKFGIDDHKNLSASVWGSYFNFVNLPAQVAQESRLRGNTVTGVGVQGAQFAYGFSGLESGLSFRYKVPHSHLTPVFNANFIDNFDSPDQTDQAYLLSSGVEIRVSDGLFLTPKAEYFYLQSDASPAYYNVTWYGHNNFEGPSGSLLLDWRREKICLEGRFSSGQVITANPIQNNFTLFYLAVSKTYDFL